jgi:hypothetical protein
MIITVVSALEIIGPATDALLDPATKGKVRGRHRPDWYATAGTVDA